MFYDQLSISAFWPIYWKIIKVRQKRTRSVHDSFRDWPIPKSVIEVRSFLGLTGYYRRFVQNFSRIAEPLTKLTRKEVKYQWTEECQLAFEKLKDRLTTTPVLAIPDGSGGMVIHSDASGHGLGCWCNKAEWYHSPQDNWNHMKGIIQPMIWN